MVTPGQILEDVIASSFARKGEDGAVQVQVWSHYSDRAKSILAGPARLITNVPAAVRLGEETQESGGDRGWDISWSET